MKIPHRDNLFFEIAYHTIRIFLSPFVKLFWIKRVSGLENIPKEGAAILAFNHQSYFDFICFIAVCPRHIHYLSAEKFFSSYFWRPVMKIMGQIKVERTSKNKNLLHSSIQSHLKRGKLVGIFPEGTRSPHKEKMLEAFIGVARYAYHGNVPVIPIGIKGAYEVMSRFDEKPKIKKSIQIIIGSPIDLSVYHKSKLNRKAFKIITNKIMLRISELSGKSYPYKIYPPWPQKI